MLDVGSIIQYTWGYGQTNQNFFEVVKRTPKTVILRELQQRSVLVFGGYHEYTYKDGEGYTIPVPGIYVDLPILWPYEFRKAIKTDEKGEEYISFDYGLAGVWDGTPQRESWYY